MNHLPPDFWHPIPIRPIQALTALRDMVLARSTKRMPKWKFRLAEDMVVQIQPRPAMPHFKCLAIVRDGADASLLSPGKKWPTDSWSIEFYISDNWHLKTRAVACHQDYSHTDIFAVRDRLISTLPIVLSKLRPDAMLKPACLCCGKQLTDPVSMSRWIGPDCFGTSSSDLPWMVSPHNSGDPQDRA